jgi:hypothetical protein
MTAIALLSFVDTRHDEVLDESLHEYIDLEIDDVIGLGDRLFVVDRIDIFCVDEKGREDGRNRFDDESNTLVAFVRCALVAHERSTSLGMEGCESCGGELTLLGTLGRTDHLRCRACRIDATRTTST